MLNGQEVQHAMMNELRQYIVELIGNYNMVGTRASEIPHNQRLGINQQNGNIVSDEEADEQKKKQDNPPSKDTPGAAVVLIMSEDGYVLSVSRKDNPLQCGMPGGKIDGDEEPIEAARRELKEETGLDAVDLREIYCDVDEEGYEVHTFACEAAGEINTDEAGLIRWVRPEVLLDPEQCPWTHYMEKLFKHVNVF